MNIEYRIAVRCNIEYVMMVWQRNSPKCRTGGMPNTPSLSAGVSAQRSSRSQWTLFMESSSDCYWVFWGSMFCYFCAFDFTNGS